MSARKRILVLCTGNSCRSQMAEGWLRHDLGDRVDAFSAGNYPCFVHPLAIRVMAEAGVDLTGHRSKSVREFVGQPFDLVITVCGSEGETCPIFPGHSKMIQEPIPDPGAFVGPMDESLMRFREARDLIRERIVPLVVNQLLVP